MHPYGWINRNISTGIRLAFCIILALASLTGRAEPAVLGSLCEADIQEHWLALASDRSTSTLRLLVLQHASGRILVRQFDLWQLELPEPDARLYRYRSELFYPLEALSAITVEVNWPERTISVESDGENRSHASRTSGAGLAELLAHCRPEPEPPTPSAASDIDSPRVNASVTEEKLEELLLQVTVNGKRQSDVALAVKRDDGTLLLPVKDMEAWRILVPDHPRFDHYGESYFPVAALSGTKLNLDSGRMTLDLTIAAEHFSETRRQGRRYDKVSSTRSTSGLFFSYDVHAEHTEWGQQERERQGGFYELGLFGGRGVLTHTALQSQNPDAKEWVRLETRWRHDNPERMTTTEWGDTITQPGAWGNAVRFGGVSWGTNFATRPDLVTFPQPQIAGEAATASTVDVYINNMRRVRTEVPAGPFAIDDVPIITGAGKIQMTTRDLLGRETVITQPFYGTTDLLRSDLYAYNYSAGAIRKRYSVENANYGEAFVSSTHRYGFTSWFTGEVRGELTENLQTYGASLSFSNARLGALHWSEAQSVDQNNISGHMREIRLERSGRYLSVGARKRETDGNFRMLSHSLEPQGQSELLQVYSSVRMSSLGSLSLSYLDRQTERDRNRIASMGYSRRLMGGASLTLSASKVLGEERGERYSVSVVIPFGRGTSASLSGQSHGAYQDGSLTLQHNPPARGGFGYRAERYFGDRSRQTLQTRWQTSVGTYRAGFAQRNEHRSYRLGARGSVAYLGRQLFASDWINGSFAAVDTSGLEGVPLYQENLHVADTNSRGWALLTGLRAFEQNRIRIDERDIPLEMQFRERPERQVVPGFRRGVLVSFDMVQERAVTITLIDGEGDPIPAGARIHTAHSGESFVVGWSGAAYLTGLTLHNKFTVYWDSQQCHFSLDYLETDDPLPDMGEYVCTEA